MLERLVLCAGMDTVTLLTALHMLVRAWDQVTAATIANCFRHYGLAVADEGTEAACQPCQHEVIPAGLRDALEEISFDDYVDADSSAVVCAALSDEDIIAQESGEEPVDEDDRDEEEEAPVRASASQVMEAIGVACLFFSFEEGEDDALRHVRALENKVTAIDLKEKKQNVITDYFHQ